MQNSNEYPAGHSVASSRLHAFICVNSQQVPQSSQRLINMVSCRQICDGVLTTLFEYDTPKIVIIKSKKVGLINRLIQLVIIVYIIG